VTRIDGPWVLPDRTIDRADEADREIRISDFFLMAALPLRSVGVADAVPLNELTMAFLVALCALRPARGGARLHPLVVAMVGALLALLVYSGVSNPEAYDWTRRMGHIAIMAGLVWAGGTGRLSLRSCAAGLAAGLIGVIVLATLDIGNSAYEDRLTGFLADPNSGAYFIVVHGTLAVFFCDDRWLVRIAVAVPLLVGLVLCFSRTGLLAGAFAVVWLFLVRRLGAVGGVLMAGFLVWVVDNVPEDLITYGPFSSRTGSDALRDRIIAQERVELANMPWYGHGPGTAKVKIGDLTFFFHNSYLGTRQEGGWLALFLVLGLMVFAFLQLSKAARGRDLRAAAAQAAILATAAMALTLGEVLLDTPMAVAVGFALGHALRSTEDPPDG
jgi:hypothetical protein